MLRQYTREEYFDRFENPNNLDYQKKSFKKFDSFLDSINSNEDNFLKHLEGLDEFQRYVELQKIIKLLHSSVSSGVTKKYFNNIFKYLIIRGLPLDYTKKKLLLKFPTTPQKTYEGLDEEKIKLLLSNADSEFKTYMTTLVGSGMRETECLLLQPHMIKFDEDPTRIKIPEEIAKFNVERETFLPKINSDRLNLLINKKALGEYDNIFNFNLIQAEKKFAIIRRDSKLDTPNRKKHQQNDFTLHSFRAYFITELGDLTGNAFASALSGHGRYMKTYYRKPLPKRQIIYKNNMKILEF